MRIRVCVYLHYVYIYIHTCMYRHLHTCIHISCVKIGACGMDDGEDQRSKRADLSRQVESPSGCEVYKSVEDGASTQESKACKPPARDATTRYSRVLYIAGLAKWTHQRHAIGDVPRGSSH